MSKNLIILLGIVSLSSCGSEDPAQNIPLPTINANGTNDNQPDPETYTKALNKPLIRTSDCVFEGGQCGGVLPIEEKTEYSGTVTFKVKAFADPTRWTQLGYPFPDDYVLNFNCQVQTCSLSDEVCKSKSLLKDLNNEFWSEGTMNGVSLRKNEQAVFYVSRAVNENHKFRIFCHYHWLLDEVEASRPLVLEYRVDP